MVSLLWRTSRPLTATGLLMVAALGAFAIGVLVDPRTISGAPAWLKPAKFAASIALYTLTLAWVFSRIPEWTRTRRIVGRITAGVMVLEMALISLQAFRGTTSHFNVATVFDGVVMSVMGLAILVQTVASVAVAAALWRHQMEDRALGWALRLGMTITLVGAMTGGLMTRPTPDQLEVAYSGEPITIVGSHTVGAADGGPGLPGTGWSRDHGDLRIPHFVGLHALQLLPVLSLVLARRRLSEEARVRLTMIAAGSYVGLYGILLSQALRGQSIVAPDLVTVALLTLWAIGTAASVMISTSRTQPRPSLATV